MTEAVQSIGRGLGDLEPSVTTDHHHDPPGRRGAGVMNRVFLGVPYEQGVSLWVSTSTRLSGTVFELDSAGPSSGPALSISKNHTCKSHSTRRDLKRNGLKCFNSFLSQYLVQTQAGKQAGRVTTTPTDSLGLAWAAQGLDSTISPVAMTTCCRLQGVLRGLDERRKEGNHDHAV